MKTIADFKRRIQVGLKFRQIYALTLGQVNFECVVTRVQSKQFVATGAFGKARECWFELPKRSEIIFTPKGWQRLDEKGSLLAEYEWIEDAA